MFFGSSKISVFWKTLPQKAVPILEFPERDVRIQKVHLIQL